MEETPQQPIMFGPMPFLARRRQELVDRIRQSQSQQSAPGETIFVEADAMVVCVNDNCFLFFVKPAPHLVRRIFLFLHPKKEMAERGGGLKGSVRGIVGVAVTAIRERSSRANNYETLYR